MANARGGRGSKQPTQSNAIEKLNQSFKKSTKKINQKFSLSERIATLADKVGGKARLAAMIDVSPQMMSRYLSTNPPSPSLNVLERILDATGCDPAWLVTGIGHPFPPIRSDSAIADDLIASTRKELIATITHLSVALSTFIRLDGAAGEEIVSALDALRELLDQTS